MGAYMYTYYIHFQNCLNNKSCPIDFTIFSFLFFLSLNSFHRVKRTKFDFPESKKKRKQKQNFSRDSSPPFQNQRRRSKLLLHLPLSSRPKNPLTLSFPLPLSLIRGEIKTFHPARLFRREGNFFSGGIRARACLFRSRRQLRSAILFARWFAA